MNAVEPASAGMPEIADIGRVAAEAKARLQRIAATATSPDGAVTVTVNTSGALQELRFGPRADELGHARLAAVVVATAKRAQVDAAQQMKGVMAPLIGTDSDAMKFLEEQIPEPEVPDEPPVPGAPRWELNDVQPAPPPAPPRPRPTRPAPPDDDDFDGGPILRRGF